VVVVGASAGGVEALSAFVASLRPDLGAAVVVVLHIAPGGTSVLPQILARAGQLPACAAADGDELVAGRIYVAPPDRHVLVDDGVLRVTAGPRENGHRPAIDPTMRSAATSHGDGVIAIVLSGTRDDGTAGAAAVKARGGRVAVQDPADALFDSMPLSALAQVDADAVLPASALGTWLAAATQGDNGRALATQGVVADEAPAPEGAPWKAVRSLEDRAVLLDRIATRARDEGRVQTAARFFDEAAKLRDEAETLRSRLGFPRRHVGSAA
jgi:hypothetical protein